MRRMPEGQVPTWPRFSGVFHLQTRNDQYGNQGCLRSVKSKSESNPGDKISDTGPICWSRLPQMPTGKIPLTSLVPQIYVA